MWDSTPCHFYCNRCGLSTIPHERREKKGFESKDWCFNINWVCILQTPDGSSRHQKWLQNYKIEPHIKIQPCYHQESFCLAEKGVSTVENLCLYPLLELVYLATPLLYLLQQSDVGRIQRDFTLHSLPLGRAYLEKSTAKH